MGWTLAAVGVTAAVLAQILAQAGSPDAQSWLDLVQYGILGLVVLGFLTGRIVPGWVHKTDVAERDQAEARKAELHAEIRELNKLFREQVIPALVRTTDTLARATDVLARVSESQQGSQQGDRQGDRR